MRLFISHIHEERAIAQAIRDELRACFGAQVEVFLAEDIPLGTNWLDEIKNALGKSDILVVLFSKYSSGRPWINIEAGYGVMAGKQVIPVCRPGFSKADLPVIYGLLQSVDLLTTKDVDRLLDQIAGATQAGQFLGDRGQAVSRWVEKISDAIRSLGKLTPRLDSPPCVWVIGSNRGLAQSQAALNKRFVGFIAHAFMQRRFRVVFGRSGLLDSLGEALSNEVREQIYGIDRETLSEFGNASAMQKNFDKAPPNPVVLLGSMRTERGANEVFLDAIGHVPDVAVIIGGSVTGRTPEEVNHAHEAGIPVLPLHFTGGVAGTVDSSLDMSLAANVSRILSAQRDFSSVAQLLCDVVEAQTAIGRNN